jgi:long-chain acyl-CoA synthetase
VYGLTETTSAITQLDAADHQVRGPREALLRSAGRPYPWVQAKIVDPATLEPCPAGETGELWVRSAQNMKGYWMNEEATAATIDEFGWLRTGDCGHLDRDGYLFLTDRLKDMIVSGGENVYPAEAERLLMEHPLVAEAAVIGVPHPAWGETAKALVVLKAGGQISELELIGWLRMRLAHYKCPTSVELMRELPRNAAGKVLKRVLREPYWKGHTRRIS